MQGTGTIVLLEKLRGVLQHLVVLSELQLALAVVEHQGCDQALQLQPAILPWLLLPHEQPRAAQGCVHPLPNTQGTQGSALRCDPGGDGEVLVQLTLAWRFLRQMTASWYLAAACANSLRRTRRLPSLCSTGTAASFSSLLMAQVSRLYAEGSSTCTSRRS